jgi:bifunctional non-homologous end joining protein LigD
VLYPETGYTKAEVIAYYSSIAPVLLPHITDRALTRVRFPDGVGEQAFSFYEKNAPMGTPDWVRRVLVDTGEERIDYVVADDPATVVWLANLAALELHTPQWKVGPRDGVHGADQLVLDLDPGAPATVVECAQVALALRELLVADGLEPVAKTSGSKGMQVYAAIADTPAERTSAYAHELAKRLEEERPELVVSRMTKALRPGKVLVDWSQNNAAKTTVSVYSLRARPAATVSAPVSWDEVEATAGGSPLAFTQAEVLERVRDGDLFAPLLRGGKRPRLPG